MDIKATIITLYAKSELSSETLRRFCILNLLERKLWYIERANNG
jgi:hypothetical protein